MKYMLWHARNINNLMKTLVFSLARYRIEPFFIDSTEIERKKCPYATETFDFGRNFQSNLGKYL